MTALLTGSALLLQTALTRAQRTTTAAPAAVELTWQAPDSCPNKEQAVSALARFLGDSRTESGRAEVTIVRHAQTFEAEIRFGGSLSGRRTLRGPACQQLTDAVLLSVAMAVDALAVVDTLAAVQGSSNAEPGAQRYLFGIRLAGDIGSLPQATLSPALVAGLELGRMKLALELGVWLPRLVTRSAYQGGSGEIGLVDAGLRACFAVLRFTRIELGPCAGAALGVSTGHGTQLATGRRSGGVWAAALAGLRIRQRSDPLLVELGPDVGVSIAHPVYVIDEAPVFGTRGPSVFVRVSLALSWLWP